ncbi:MAG: hypothetical protein K2Q10_13285 [Rhodospirillales bacterium]|nr:hypothetical protein [Rhodospirillales bacterium]
MSETTTQSWTDVVNSFVHGWSTAQTDVQIAALMAFVVVAVSALMAWVVKGNQDKKSRQQFTAMPWLPAWSVQ